MAVTRGPGRRMPRFWFGGGLATAMRDGSEQEKQGDGEGERGQRKEQAFVAGGGEGHVQRPMATRLATISRTSGSCCNSVQGRLLEMRTKN